MICRLVQTLALISLMKMHWKLCHQNVGSSQASVTFASSAGLNVTRKEGKQNQKDRRKREREPSRVDPPRQPDSMRS
jgi:hypothetical protein